MSSKSFIIRGLGYSSPKLDPSKVLKALISTIIVSSSSSSLRIFYYRLNISEIRAKEPHISSKAPIIIGYKLPKNSIIIRALGIPIASIGLNSTISTLLRTSF